MDDASACLTICSRPPERAISRKKREKNLMPTQTLSNVTTAVSFETAVTGRDWFTGIPTCIRTTTNNPALSILKWENDVGIVLDFSRPSDVCENARGDTCFEKATEPQLPVFCPCSKENKNLDSSSSSSLVPPPLFFFFFPSSSFSKVVLYRWHHNNLYVQRVRRRRGRKERMGQSGE